MLKLTFSAEVLGSTNALNYSTSPDNDNVSHRRISARLICSRSPGFIASLTSEAVSDLSFNCRTQSHQSLHDRT